MYTVSPEGVAMYTHNDDSQFYSVLIPLQLCMCGHSDISHTTMHGCCIASCKCADFWLAETVQDPVEEIVEGTATLEQKTAKYAKVITIPSEFEINEYMNGGWG